MIFQVDNKTVFASDSGKGIDQKKATIVLLHGSGLSHIVWSLTEQYLSNQNYNVLAIDLPGHGNSEGDCLKSIEEISDWLEKVFKELNVSELTIIGHSQGCLEALEYSLRYSKRVKNLIFIGGSYRMPVNQDLIDLAESGDDKAVQLMMKWSYENSKKFIGGNPVKIIINSPRNGNISSSFPVYEGDEIMISTNKGRVIRIAVKEIRTAGRNTQGVRIKKLSGSEKVVSVIKIEDNIQ